MLDEFFMVRVAGLTGQTEAGVSRRLPDGRTPQQTLDEARDRVLEVYGSQSELWRDELCPALAEERIVISSVEELEPEELAELDDRFEREVFPVLTPLAVGPGQPFPYISALSISLGLFVADPETGEERFARVKVPEGLPRFLPVGRRGRFVPLERVLSHYLPELFPGMEILERSLFRVTRDGDLEVSDEADDLLEAVELELRRARFGEVTRLEVSQSMSQAMRERLQQGLRVADEVVYPLEGKLDLADLGELWQLDRPDLKNEPWLPVSRPPWNSIESAAEQFAALRAGDLVVHHPYDSFASSFESYVDRAAADPAVIAIKSTGVRQRGDKTIVPGQLDAPFNLRERLVEEIRRVAEAAAAGKKARIRIKVNGLTHPQLIDELYAASEVGTRIELLVRGVCSLRPGVPALSEHVRVRSVLGRFLEHSRLFIFDAADRSVCFMGSADLMPRNLDHRVEVVTPIEDVAIQAELASTFEALWRDTASSFELDDNGVWQRVHPKKDERARSGQQILMRRARRRLSLARTH